MRCVQKILPRSIRMQKPIKIGLQVKAVELRGFFRFLAQITCFLKISPEPQHLHGWFWHGIIGRPMVYTHAKNYPDRSRRC
jgi:hypothetical protein